MCGIAGWIDFSATSSSNELREGAKNMALAIANRGPDAAGEWIDPKNGVAFSHRRLSILDLSELGAQPMLSPSERFLISFNGEIYNFLELKSVLQQMGHAFRGGSDTEVLLAAIEEWGLAQTLPKLEGMFAFALFDRIEKKITLCRDRLGEKPLAYCFHDQYFWFASELKSFPRSIQWKKSCSDIDVEAIPNYLQFGYIAAPRTIYKHVKKLMPGHQLSFYLSDGGNHPILEEYWSPKKSMCKTSAEVWGEPANTESTIQHLDDLLTEVVSKQMITDVPYGAFLSGGVDSSTITAMMQKQSNHRIRTFSIGFYEEEYNEVIHARAVANHLGTEHTELMISARDALNVVPKLPSIYDEPFADASQIPTYLVSELARKSVTVALSGDGGDEVFAGYYRHTRGPALWSKVKRIPHFLRAPVSGLLMNGSTVQLKMLSFIFSAFSDNLRQTSLLEEKIKKAAALLGARDELDVYFQLQNRLPRSLEMNLRSTMTTHADPFFLGIQDPLSRQQYLDFMNYLPNDILVKVDRATMANGLESRMPFLDEKLIDFAWKIPAQLKVRDGIGKWILRQVLYRYVPQKLIDRPKAGFAVPISEWLRGPLKAWAESLLEQDAKANHGWWTPDSLNRIWREHQNKTRDSGALLWHILMLRAWLEENLG